VKQTIIAIVLVGATSALAHLHVVAQTYYPVVRVVTPEGLVLTAVHEPTSERAECAAANGEFLAPFKTMCKDCRVVTARCERALAGFEAELGAGTTIGQHRISAPGVLNLAIDGPLEIAQLTCNEIARARFGGDIRCVPPAGRPTPNPASLAN
jgi:hypothetical protein